jgi:hypothetical protein
MRDIRSRSAVVMALALAALAPADALGGSEPPAALVALVQRSLQEGTCVGDGARVVCSLSGFVAGGRLAGAQPGPAQLPYQAIHLVVHVTPGPDAIRVEEVHGLLERWAADRDATTVEQVLLPLWGPQRGQVFARRLRLDGASLVAVDELAPTREDVRALGDLLERLLLSSSV